MKLKTWSASMLILLSIGLIRGGTISLEVIPGKNWSHTHKMGLIKLNVIPQMAFWLEDSSGNFVTTLYVTERTGTQKWRTGPGERKRDVRRPSALPVWAHARGVRAEDGLYMPTLDNPVADAVTGATPKSGFTRNFEIPDSIADGIYFVFAEVNSAFDYNDAYDEDSDPDFSGQPSLIWKSPIMIGEEKFDDDFEIIGHGHVQGRDGIIDSDLSGFTTALDIIEGISISYKP